jgi:dGTP triphosphohydrolase
MSTKTVTEIVKKPNALEDAFGIPSGSTEITVEKPVTENTQVELYDEKDRELEQQINAVKDMAQYTFEKIQDIIEDVEPKYTARLLEVGSTYLNIMHDTLKTKTKIKSDKDKIAAKPTSPTRINQTTNNTIISTPSDIIRSLRNGDLNAIEGEFIVKQEDDNGDKNP